MAYIKLKTGKNFERGLDNKGWGREKREKKKSEKRVKKWTKGENGGKRVKNGKKNKIGGRVFKGKKKFVSLFMNNIFSI